MAKRKVRQAARTVEPDGRWWRFRCGCGVVVAGFPSEEAARSWAEGHRCTWEPTTTAKPWP